jgi:tetratricopeptide (TPR) repeat protein
MFSQRFIYDVFLWESGKKLRRDGRFCSCRGKIPGSPFGKSEESETPSRLGKLFETEGKLPLAFDEYSNTLALDSSAMSRINLGNALLGMGKYDGAIDQYSHALDKSNNDPYAQYNLAFALYKKGNFDQALSRFQKGERAHPGDAGFRLGAGTACYRLGNMREAAVYFM